MNAGDSQLESASTTPAAALSRCQQAPIPFTASQQNPGIRAVSLQGPAGRLEALLNEGAPDVPFAALLCHPHPVYGGTLHNKVVYRAMKVLNDPEWALGWPVLRFNFRGAGLSQGTHDGEAEAGDVLAALDWLTSEFRRPIFVGGYSFGAVMAHEACCGAQAANHDVRALALLGLPASGDGRNFRYNFLNNSHAPKLMLSGDRDSFASADELARIADATPDPKRLVIIPGADHFFTDHMDAMQHELAHWIEEQVL